MKMPPKGNLLMVAAMSVCAVVLAALLAAALMATKARGRDLGQWAQNDPETRAWYKRQMMPDYPKSPCCGEADAYYADRVEVDAKGGVYAIITDTREDAPLGRPNIPVGTRIPIPDFKNKDTRSDPNPTGHSIIFVRWYAEQEGGNFGVLCFMEEYSCLAGRVLVGFTSHSRNRTPIILPHAVRRGCSTIEPSPMT